MKRTAWLVAAFAAGMIVNAAATRTKADTTPFPSWVTLGSCFVTAGTGAQVVLEIQGSWVKTRDQMAGVEEWRNLAVAPFLRRESEETCRHLRGR